MEAIFFKQSFKNYNYFAMALEIHSRHAWFNFLLNSDNLCLPKGTLALLSFLGFFSLYLWLSVPSYWSWFRYRDGSKIITCFFYSIFVVCIITKHFVRILPCHGTELAGFNYLSFPTVWRVFPWNNCVRY